MFQSRRFWFSYRLGVEADDEEVPPELLLVVVLPELELSTSGIESMELVIWVLFGG